MATYQFDNLWHQARQRLRGIEATWDPGTIRHLETLGVSEGWQCLEVGGGGGLIAEWLSQRVGPSGHVLATDINTRFLEALHAPNLEVRRHDILADELPEGAFDLVHVRAVLMHMSEPAATVRRMVAALKPGGWLLAEEVDFSTLVPEPTAAAVTAALFQKGMQAVVTFIAGGDYGQSIYRDLRVHGLVQRPGGRASLLGVRRFPGCGNLASESGTASR